MPSIPRREVLASLSSVILCPMEREGRSSQGKRWCFTLNNPTEEQSAEFINEVMASGRGYKYLVFQLEAGEQGTPHYQGFVIFDGNRRFQTVRELLPTAHWEPAKGSSPANQHYCKKPNGSCHCTHCDGAVRLAGPWEYGSCPSGSGARSDLLHVRDLIRNGKRKRDLIDDDEAVKVLAKYPKFVDELLAHIPPKRDSAVEVHLLYGPSGCGKTRFAREEEDLWFTPLGSPNWFDGYDQHEAVLLDDFAGPPPLLWSDPEVLPPSTPSTTRSGFSTSTSREPLSRAPTLGGSPRESTSPPTSTPAFGSSGRRERLSTPPSLDASPMSIAGTPPDSESYSSYEEATPSSFSSLSSPDSDSIDLD